MSLIIETSLDEQALSRKETPLCTNEEACDLKEQFLNGELYTDTDTQEFNFSKYNRIPIKDGIEVFLKVEFNTLGRWTEAEKSIGDLKNRKDLENTFMKIYQKAIQIIMEEHGW